LSLRRPELLAITADHQGCFLFFLFLNLGNHGKPPYTFGIFGALT
jgi:hypothetical protein